MLILETLMVLTLGDVSGVTCLNSSVSKGYSSEGVVRVSASTSLNHIPLIARLLASLAINRKALNIPSLVDLAEVV